MYLRPEFTCKLKKNSISRWTSDSKNDEEMHSGKTIALEISPEIVISSTSRSNSDLKRVKKVLVQYKSIPKYYKPICINPIPPKLDFVPLPQIKKQKSIKTPRVPHKILYSPKLPNCISILPFLFDSPQNTPNLKKFLIKK